MNRMILSVSAISLLMATSLAATSACALAMFGVDSNMMVRKDDPHVQEQLLKALHKEMGDLAGAIPGLKKSMEDKYTELNNKFGGVEVKTLDANLQAEVKSRTEEYAALVAQLQSVEKALDMVKRDIDQPIHKGGKDLADKDRENAIKLQRSIHLFKGGSEHDFREDTDKLVIAKDYRSAARKLVERGGIDDKQTIIRSFNDAEKKAFDAASLDAGFFMPEMLGIEVDCEIECAELLDLYAQVTVSRTNFLFPHVQSYGDIGSYQCDAKCDAELGPEGNISYKNGKTFDFRGVFCFQRKTLQEANYDLLGFMFRAAARSHRINRNRALITGDGINEPLGWLTGDCFTKIGTPALSFNHQIWRRFLASAPVEYGPVVATMHQNVFAYLASAVDTTGRFIFGDGMMTFSPDDVRERIRISNCLPDATAGGTRGNAASPFVAGDFIAAAGNWGMAYASVSKRPMFMEQFIGGSSAWCVKYQFGAEDGGFVMCCPAARTLYVGA